MREWWQIYQLDALGNRAFVERADSERQAQRALLIFIAHELGCERKPRFSVIPAVRKMDPNDFNLPTWVTNAFDQLTPDEMKELLAKCGGYHAE